MAGVCAQERHLRARAGVSVLACASEGQEGQVASCKWPSPLSPDPSHLRRGKSEEGQRQETEAGGGGGELVAVAQESVPAEKREREGKGVVREP